MSKPFYKSSTIQAAISSFVILLINTAYSTWQPDTGTFRAPTQVEVATVLGGAIALKETIEGRRRATESIGKASNNETQPTETQALVSMDSVDNEEDDLDVSFSNLTGKYYLVAQVDTKLKTSPVQSSELASTDYREVGQWQRIDIDGWKFLEEKNDHIEIILDEYSAINNGKFYAFAPHFKLFNLIDKEIEIGGPTSAIPVISKNKTAIKLPGYQSAFYLEDPIYPGSSFYWREALRNGDRKPSEKSQVDNIIAMAKNLDAIRSFLGNRPMVITSWLRPNKPVDINRQVGGVSNSRHITGDGVDFLVPSMNMFDVQERLKSYCQKNNLGLGLGAKRGFVHVDLAGFRIWNY